MEANLVAACRRCNRQRGSRPVDAYVRALSIDGRAPRLAALKAALERPSRSSRQAEVVYATAQLSRLARLEPLPMLRAQGGTACGSGSAGDG